MCVLDVADKNLTPLRLADNNYGPAEEVQTAQESKAKWRSKPLHGRYLNTIESEAMDTEGSTTYLRTGNLFIETEGFIAALQDQVVSTKIYRRNILKEQVDNAKCRMCGEKDEYLDHILSGCSVLAPKAYLDRHNRVAGIVHQNLRVEYMGLTETTPYYQYTPQPVYETENALLYWNRPIITDRTIPNNIPDIVLTLKNEKRTYIIDIAVPLPSNIMKTHAEKINKYLPLADEIKKMWKMESVTIVPIVVGATGEIPHKLHAGLKTLKLQNGLYIPIQKSVLLDTCSIVRRVLGDQE
ncbi:hypothetical protein NQ314_002623 [Rhamnusium bicolor]|uniref:Uncharacterized protein n=1 Tax=Rhamnusium bicolor TaxID=1586634 RepID=A0AAV8ZR63_9CUCU|nr:hypothetical protein NQ314_002623 [Rhamnusium bicolor]